MILAMAMMFGGMSGMPMGGGSAPRQRPQRKLSPEEEAEVLVQRQATFMADLEKHNANRKANFPKFKEFEVYGLKIIAFSLKNAIRDMNSLMRSNLIQIKQEDVQVQGQV
jgi:hypothetical protein